MKTSSIILASVTGLGLTAAAGAAELAPLQAATFVVGNQIASVYYRDHGASYEVVTTIAPDADLGGAPMRVIGSLSLGERQTISFGEFGANAAPKVLELVHDGDRLVVTVTGKDIASR